MSDSHGAGKNDPATEHCTYCPKLCRHACPVAAADTREALVTQQKMQALGELDAERQAAPSSWFGSGQGADISGLTGLLANQGAALRVGQDAVSLVASGTQLKGFAGLSEGVSKLAF